jgi:L-alanine-DL-glutamate epimerase-like enolase superfamily enzyme
MRIVEIRERSASISSSIRNAYIDFSRMTVSVVALITDVVRDGSPVIGYGFCSNGRYAQGGILRERFIPRIIEADPASLCADMDDNLDPLKIWNTFMANEKPGGHGDRAVAAGALDMAVWDAVAKIAEQPLWRLLSERYNGGQCDQQVLVYPGGGYYYPGKQLVQLQEEMRGYRDAGYRVVKMKIGGADLDTDLHRIEAVLEVVGDGRSLAVDANGRFDLPQALAYGEAIRGYDLFWYEEPGDPLDYLLHATLAQHYPAAIATGENLFSHQDLVNLLRYGGLRPDRDWVQLDPALSYGLTEYLRVIASESYPGVFQPFGGFADAIPIVDGYTRGHDTPGIGVELKQDLYTELRRLTAD